MLASDTGKILSVNGFEMFYEIHGTGSPLLLLHGFTGSGKALLPLFKSLTKTHQLIIPDLRGHGRSTNPSKKFTFQQAMQDVFALLDHLNIDKCSAIGFSGGGCTLLQMAVHQPERIQSLVLVSATPYFPKQVRDLMRTFTVEGRTKDEWEAMRKIHLHGDSQIRLLWEHAQGFSESYDDMNLTPLLLTKIKAKTLLVQGDRDPFYPIEITVEMYRNIANAYLWIVPNGGHVPTSEEFKQEFLNYITQFI